jgi:hypothetical protein
MRVAGPLERATVRRRQANANTRGMELNRFAPGKDEFPARSLIASAFSRASAPSRLRPSAPLGCRGHHPRLRRPAQWEARELKATVAVTKSARCPPSRDPTALGRCTDKTFFIRGVPHRGIPRLPTGTRAESSTCPPLADSPGRAAVTRAEGQRGLARSPRGVRHRRIPLLFRRPGPRRDFRGPHALGCQPASAQSSPLTAELQIRK